MNILWDFDGTIIDSYPVFTRIFRETIGQEHSDEEILSHLKISFTHAREYYQLTDVQMKEIFDKEGNMHPTDTQPFADVEDVLRHANINVIMTHNKRDVVETCLKYYGLNKYIKEIVSRDDGYPKKPDPSSYQYLHDKYQIDLAIGDRDIDILPAKALGIRTCLFQNNTSGADYYISKYRDFFTIDDFQK
ncbi:HAD family hydrolase [Paenibacillus albiflavus]|uniref:HAD family hydrolase n=1 Tax=Paenibacillus albiflavus TaxID=2545760 RepID=A0A4R4ERJ5_9BACL|nr:HAD-IA family hydrolase [Paenibacillus albiflavus]TCZ81281.1 HAD family hydrolase [Paenibacillus albiflavus]